MVALVFIKKTHIEFRGNIEVIYMERFIISEVRGIDSQSLPMSDRNITSYQIWYFWDSHLVLSI